ncbi:hypothetical protein L6164_026357 [Bauhinia variegata]|uniref:Uncharacterized protein n=1 Tax=Bauhinia variegata TaxID=167791 RepID=A0ACB9LRE2_BAUVA|nr:hypothetical protein L6164_026357 [Bauhinia variegata]
MIRVEYEHRNVMLPKEHRQCALEDGPWMIYDHYLSVSCWNLEFIPSNIMLSTIRVWVCFPVLNMLYYNKSVLKAIASTIGKPIKVDNNTLEVLRGRFVRALRLILRSKGWEELV